MTEFTEETLTARTRARTRATTPHRKRRSPRTCCERVAFLMQMCQFVCMTCFEWCMWLLGPILIIVVIILVSTESYWVLKYMVLPCYGISWFIHAAIVTFLLINGMFNYFMCVTTNPGTHCSDIYADLVYEASQDGWLDKTDWESYADHHGRSRHRHTNTYINDNSLEQRMEILGGRQRVTPSNNKPLKPNPQSWLDRGPYHWGWCKYTHGPKAPRSHFDHVTKKLVLNMDHYCPWMFNVVGYANYRYFVLFLIYVTIACIYGLFLTTLPFFAMVTKSPQARARRPKSKEARSAVLFTFVLALSVGLAVAFLCGWHIFLTLTAQTTIEFYGNHTLRHRAKAKGIIYRNPYDQGMRKNWAHVFGPGHPLLALLPSRRKPSAPPWPSPSAVRRFHNSLHQNRGGGNVLNIV